MRERGEPKLSERDRRAHRAFLIREIAHVERRLAELGQVIAYSRRAVSGEAGNG